jgi:enoyl-CoA hydratase/carnithine racemase
MTGELHARADGSAWRITLNRPDRRNALTPALAGEIADAVEEGARTGAAAVLLEGAGGHFCAGLDLRWLAALGAAPSPAEIRAGLEQFQAAILAIVRAPIPIIALIRGSAAGFGVDLAVACDLRVAGSTATFTSAFARMGLVPDGGSTYGLPRLIGDGAALRFLLTGEVVNAATAHRIGLVDELVDDAELDARAAALSAALAGGAAGSISAIKRLCRADEIAGLERALRAEAEAQIEAFGGTEFQRRLTAFLSRTPEPKPA